MPSKVFAAESFHETEAGLVVLDGTVGLRLGDVFSPLSPSGSQSAGSSI